MTNNVSGGTHSTNWNDIEAKEWALYPCFVMDDPNDIFNLRYQVYLVIRTVNHQPVTQPVMMIVSTLTMMIMVKHTRLK